MKNQKTTICGIVATSLASLSLTPGMSQTWSHIFVVLSIAANSMGHTFAADADTNPKQEPK